jgi:2-oxoglutarate dehydrogenase E1 component
MSELLDFHGPNAGYVAELYEQYQKNPDAVDAETRAYFANGFDPDAIIAAPAPTPTSSPAPTTFAAPSANRTPPGVSPDAAVDLQKAVSAARLGRIVRELGHLDAHLDPLGSEPPSDPSLKLETHHLTPEDLRALPASVIGGPLAEGAAHAEEALARLREAYSGSVGYEDDQVQIAEEREWLRNAIETRRFFRDFSAEDKKEILRQLAAVDTFEQFLQKTQPFQGQKRFSIEGCDTMVPMLDTIIRCSARAGTREVVMGMAHRGRLNVLAHVLNKPYEVMLAEFPLTTPGAPVPQPAVSGNGSQGYTGDVKYHKGYRRAYTEDDGGDVMPITLAPNPSHLEFVDPVVMGRARAAQEKRHQSGTPEQDIKASLAIQIHGDAAFPGQGVVAETLNLGRLRGYTVGGSIHIIANNQIGFTTNPGDARSTLYASDLAKGFEMPIVHVNADDPEACIAVARMACAYRERFGRDFLIDLIGYRRLGHNETDEPAFTQPRMYEKIRSHPRPHEIWANRLIAEGVVTADEAAEMVKAVQARLMEARSVVLNGKSATASGHGDYVEKASLVPPKTAVPTERLVALNDALLRFPEGFTADEKLLRLIFAPRRDALNGEKSILWAHAEALAYASLLEDGTPVRLTGQDSERGTFTQRHLVAHDPTTGARYCPLQNIPTAKAAFALFNSPLSETAALGFEYGYSVHATDTLVLWEAQYGDFGNGAQVIVDQFIVSGNAKWGQSPSVVLLLPHGYEGNGPEHSSARLERFLQLCAGDNMRVANCTTAAQYFHLLRRQAALLQTEPRPLVVMTPKSTLRHPRVASSVQELAEGIFQPVLDDPRDAARKAGVTRLLLCSGKVYIDLVYEGAAKKYAEREAYQEATNVAVARVEELYPFPTEELQALFASYPGLKEVYWVQEEPKNMGAWTFMAPRLTEMLPAGVKLKYVGRPEAASPAEGSASDHDIAQKRIVLKAYAFTAGADDVGAGDTASDAMPPEADPSEGNVTPNAATKAAKPTRAGKAAQNGVHPSNNGSGDVESAASKSSIQRTEAETHAR